MSTYCVFHSVPADFGCDRPLTDFPTGYIHVADVETSSLDGAFELTNHINSPWWTNPGVTHMGNTARRSTSTGDIIVNVNTGIAWRCDDVGWTKVPIQITVPDRS